MSRPEAGRTRTDRAGTGQGGNAAHWPLAGALVLLLLVGMTALGPLLRGSGWWFVMAFTAAAVLLGSAGIRRLGARPWVGPLAGAGLLTVLLTLLFGAGTGLLWLVPTLDTVDRFRGLVESGMASVQVQGTPADPVPGIVFLLCVGAGVIAILMDALAVTLRAPALAGLPVLVPAAVPGIILDDGAEKLALVLTAAAYLVLLRVDVVGRRRRDAAETAGAAWPDRPWRDGTGRPGPIGPVGGSLLVGGLGIVCALLLSVALPSLPGDGRVGGRGGGALLFGEGVSAMVNLGQDLRSPRASAALHYRTSAAQPPYLKMLTLDQFVGVSWTARVDPANTSNTLESIDRPQGLSAQVPTSEETTQIVVDGVATSWLPAPNDATKVSGLVGAWYWNGPTGTISSTNSNTRGQQYTVTSLQVEPTPDQLRAARGRYPVSVESSLDLPRNLPAVIGQTARSVTGTAATPYDEAVALQDYLRGPEFTYDTEAPVQDGYDGGGVDVVGTFLEVKRGYCVHFASAMAVMARTLGIPARIAIGYLPGSRSSNFIEGRDRFNVDAHDLHAWPELYFTGIGWLPFEPTPGRGTVPAYTQPEGQATPLGAPVAGLSSAAPRPLDQAEQPGGASGAAAATLQADAGAPGRVALLLAAVLVLLGAPGGIRLARRARRRRDLVRGVAGGAEAWRELSDTAVDHGLPVRPTETPRELAARLADSLDDGRAGATGGGSAGPDSAGPAATTDAGPDSAAALARLLAAAERARYGRPGTREEPGTGAGLAADLARVTDALHRGASRPARWRARILPASLWRGRERRVLHPAGDA